MANRYVKRCFTSVVISEMQIKAIRRHRYALVRKTLVKKTDNDRYRQECGYTGILVDCQWELKMAWETVRQFFKTLNIQQLHLHTSQQFHFWVSPQER